MENIKPSETSELNELLSQYSPIFSEVRKRIFATLFVFAASSVAGFVYYEKIIRIFTITSYFISEAKFCKISSPLKLPRWRSGQSQQTVNLSPVRAT